MQLSLRNYAVPATLLLAMGALAGLGYGEVALGALVALIVCVALIAGVDARFYGLIPVAMVLLVPWQMLPQVRSTIVLYPVLWATALLLLFGIMRGRTGSVVQPQVLLGLGVAAWAVIGLVLGHGQAALAFKWIALWASGMAVFLMLTGPNARITLVKAAPALGLVSSGYVVIEWILRRNVLYGNVVSMWVEQQFLSVSTFRPTGLTGHPLTVADITGLLILLTVTALRMGLGDRRVTIAALVTEIVALIVTGARGALIVACISAALLLLVSNEAFGRRLKYVVGVLIGAALAWQVLGDFLVARFTGAAESQSMQQRVASMAAASATLQSSPWFGRGAGYGALALADLGYRVINYESEWAGLVIGIGAVGALAALAIPLIGMAKSIRLSWRGPARDIAVACAVYAVGIVGTHNMFEWWGGLIVFWACIAFSVPDPELAQMAASDDA